MLRSTTSDGASSETPVDVRLGPGGYGVVGGDGGGLVVIDATTRKRIPLTGVVGTGFKLVRWQDGIAFFGVALGEDGKPLAVMSCNLSKPQLHHWSASRIPTARWSSRAPPDAGRPGAYGDRFARPSRLG